MHFRMCCALVALIVAVSGAASADQQAPKAFKDCETCPEMVAIPSGSFRMGSPPAEAGHSDDEGPVQLVTIDRRIAVGKFEVTRGEYAAFAEATGRAVVPGCYVEETGDWELRPDRSWRDPGYPQTDRHPVVCVSWDEARVYTVWLSQRTGRRYRLLSEAEWEYAARAGTDTAGFWGDDSALACDFANVHDRISKAEIGISWDPHACDDGAARTAAVGRYRANAFGLHDALGNVWEWAADCWIEDYQGAPSDGTAQNSGPCENRLLRGGSWYYGPVFNRAAERTGVPTAERFFDAGFRVAAELE